MSYTEHFKPVDPQGIHVVRYDGELAWLSVPFSACCMDHVGCLRPNTLVYVEQVGIDGDDELVYLVESYAYHHTHFVVDSSY